MAAPSSPSPDLEGLTARLLDAAKAAGAEAADAIAVAGDSLSIEVRMGALEQAERAEGVDLGLRVLVGRRQACVSSSDTRPDTIAAMAERAVAMAREAPEDPWCGLADPSELAEAWDVAALDLVDADPLPSAATLEEAALVAEGAALAVPGVSRMDGTGASWSSSRIYLAATNGFSGGYGPHRPRHPGGRDHSATAPRWAGLRVGQPHPPRRARRARNDRPPRRRTRAVAMHGASKPPTGAFPVVYDERVSGGLIGHLLGAINGAAVARGSTWLADAVGTRVLPEGIDLVEDPLRPRVSGSRPFDGEGLPAVRRALVADGVLTGWILDLASGRQLGMPSTGNAGRGTSSPPSPSVGNLALTEGPVSREGLLKEMGTGLLVTSLIGASINSTTGDYSRGASGFWIENGEIVRPVNECTIAGNLRDMLRSIRPANDGRAWTSRVIPSLLVEGLVVAGA